MSKPRPRRAARSSGGGDVHELGGARVGPGERADVNVLVSQRTSGAPVYVPAHVWRGAAPGPTLLVTGTLHGDEINGAGIVRRIIDEPRFELLAGTLVLVPVINVLGFERNSRYMPDRRDLNRAFPGSASGSLTARYAHALFHEFLLNSDCCIDLHSAASLRTNYPNVRVDLTNSEASALAVSFGCELVIDGEGPDGSFRKSACAAGVPTMILEAGEVSKIEPSVEETGARGVRNALIHLKMTEGEPVKPPYQALIHKTVWVRASNGGVLRFHAGPGDVVDQGQPLATNTDLLGRPLNVIESPAAGVLLGMTTLPAVAPGDPVAHLAIPDGGVEWIRKALKKARTKDGHAHHEIVREHLSTNVVVDEWEEGPE
ncbi:MAG: succinylglutamate desuccinylase/aspartoacylase family protein [Phycisphaeraceae bacterium]|nr:succinylglutamate desuccinylase/aspartoacylase family protein [Phycisphaeraceae bacterium]MCB9847158.1 succinylglutamate desuccinylase/aspartoacylase family protein [Phycisphaeraceae bacterium]